MKAVNIILIVNRMRKLNLYDWSAIQWHPRIVQLLENIRLW